MARRDRPTPRTTDQDADGLGHGVRRAVRTDATAFGYSILVTATFGIVDLRLGTPSVARLFAFVLGATFGFALWEAVASRGFRVRLREERSEVVLIGTALAPVSVSLGLLAAWGSATIVEGTAGWAVAPFTATVVYVLVAGIQLTVARRYEQQHPPREEA